jgi:GNAT superfamily N-acetyltransferase
MTVAPYSISTDPSRLDVERIHHWLSTDAYWAMGRSLQVMRRAIDGSTNFGAYHDEAGQVGFARVVSDLATFAWLCDVYVERGHRGNGLGIQLVTAVVEHLAPYRLRRLLLATADAHGLYERFGFQPLAEPERYLAMPLSAGHGLAVDLL